MSERYSGPIENAFKMRENLKDIELRKRIDQGEDLDSLNLEGYNLAGMNLEGKSFRGSDVRDLILYHEGSGGQPEVRTNIRNTNWQECCIGEQRPQLDFRFVDAEGASFGYFETLEARNERHSAIGKAPLIQDTGGLFNFNGSGGSFARTTWTNVDFGGFGDEPYMEAYFKNADLTGAILEGCNLRHMDFSSVKIDNIQIIDPIDMVGLTITFEQVEVFFNSIRLRDQIEQTKFEQIALEEGAKRALEQNFGIIIQ